MVIPESGAEYAYIKRGYGRVMAFLFTWTAVILAKPASLAIITMTCAEYITVMFFDDGCGAPPLMIKKIVATIIIGTNTAVLVLTTISVFFDGINLILI